MRDLDRGEAESIALALELDAELTLLDEKEGRHAAQRLGLRVIGVAGVLLEAKANGAVDKVRPHLVGDCHRATETRKFKRLTRGDSHLNPSLEIGTK